MVLISQGFVDVFIKVDLFFAGHNMLVQPPMYRLETGIPGIPAIIAVAVVAGFGQDRSYIGRYGEIIADIVWLGTFCFVLFGMKELDRN